MKKFTSFPLLIVLLLACLSVKAQTQKGADINGEAAGDYSGYAISMPNATTIAIGAQANSSNAGHTRVFNWNGNAWVQLGSDIDGEAPNDISGFSISMPDMSTVAIGAPMNSGNGSSAGHARVYSWNGTAWIQKGIDLDGEAANDNSGWSVSMPDANTIAIGAFFNSGAFQFAGHVRVYSWDGTAWIQKGTDIDGSAFFDLSGYSVCMPDANTLAVGAPGSNGLAGTCKIYSWDGISWIQKGSNLDGEAAGDQFGTVVDMPDANTIAVGAPFNQGNGVEAGHVRIFSWNGTSWIQKGSDVDAEAAGDQCGTSISMLDVNHIAIGAPYNDGNGSNSGHARVYSWNGSAWVQIGSDIDGEFSGDYSGTGIAMPDAFTLASGAAQNNGNGIFSGQVRVFDLCQPVIQTQTISSCVAFTWIDGNTYTSSTNSATYILPGAAANGCDSILTLHLTIGNAPQLQNVFVDQIGDNTAEVHWNALPGANMFQVRYRTVGSAYWTNGGTMSGNSISKTITGLQGGSNYELEVRAFCTPSLPGPWCNAVNFTTASLCIAPGILPASNTTANSVTLNWTPVSGTNYYQLRYRIAGGSGAWMSAGTAQGTTNSKVLGALLMNTDYEWQMRSICNPSPFSTGPWSTLGFFTTLSSKPGFAHPILKLTDEMTLYPNPCNTKLMVEISTPEVQRVRLSVFDFSGRLVKQVHTEIQSGYSTLEVDTRSLHSGLYTLQLWGNGLLKQTVKFSKQE